jgi:tripartite-type tricarboxylate transporter receptor subunit TctC
MKKIIAIFLFAFSASVFAWQPKDTVQLVVPFPPGGSTDIIGRIVAEGLQAQTNATVIVVNRPGASGAIGTNSVIEAKSDGHTLLLTGTSFLFNRLQNTAGSDYNLTRSLAHVGLIGTVPNHLYAHKKFENVKFTEVIKNLKQGQVYSWGVTNSGAEFTAKLLESKLGVKLNIIPYKGSAPAIVDLAGGHIDFVFDSGSSGAAVAAVDANRIFLFANLNSKKDSSNTVDSVVPGVITQSWFGLSLPKDTDRQTVLYYNSALNKVLTNPTIQDKLTKILVSIKPGTPEAFVDLINADFQKYSKIAN